MPTSTSQQPLDHPRRPRRRPRAPSCSTLALSAMMLLHRSVGAFMTQVGQLVVSLLLLPPSLTPSLPPTKGSSTQLHPYPPQNTGPRDQQQAPKTAVCPAG